MVGGIDGSQIHSSGVLEGAYVVYRAIMNAFRLYKSFIFGLGYQALLG
jgi:hypothetical protein